ncbi:hypothetical protein [uncultured Duncaniella sp.]|uniref:hypothetical protein n=1 Tax=uncultured Duncaniella sp. TaxID=2768039 RepID=UPI0026764322|nr:hypothetical protein [uncultured Duncaniella sp.]
MKNLPVSKKVYADISSRISSALSHAPASASEAMRLVDSHLQGATTVSDDTMAMLAFNMIKSELDRAIIRSTRARERAKTRRKARPKMDDRHSLISALLPDTDTQIDIESQLPDLKLSRRSRRILERLEKGKKKKWGSIM